MADLDTENQSTESEQQEQEQDTRSPAEQVESLLFPIEKDEGGEAQQDDEQETEQETEQEEEEEEEKIDYNKLIPLKTGEKVTLGALKDTFQEQAERLVEVQERELKISQKAKHAEEMAEWLNAIPEEYKQRAADEIKAEAEKEFAALTEAIPSWKDPDAFKAGKAEVFKLAEEYGLQELLSSVNDHRAILLMRDFAQLKAAVKNARANVKPLDKKKPKSKPKPRDVSKTDKLADRAKQTGDRQDQIAAVGALLKG